MPFHSLYALAFTMRPSQEFGVYWDRTFYSKEKGTKLLRNREINNKKFQLYIFRKQGGKSIFKKNKGTGTSWKGLYKR